MSKGAIAVIASLRVGIAVGALLIGESTSIPGASRQVQVNTDSNARPEQRGGDSVDVFAARLNPQSILRNELGDSGYERFLEAQGQRTTVQISTILDGSPGSQAGFQAGDEIVSYNGRRTLSSKSIATVFACS